MIQSNSGILKGKESLQLSKPHPIPPISASPIKVPSPPVQPSLPGLFGIPHFDETCSHQAMIIAYISWVCPVHIREMRLLIQLTITKGPAQCCSWNQVPGSHKLDLDS